MASLGFGNASTSGKWMTELDCAGIGGAHPLTPVRTILVRIRRLDSDVEGRFTVVLTAEAARRLRPSLALFDRQAGALADIQPSERCPNCQRLAGTLSRSYPRARYLLGDERHRRGGSGVSP
jgi:hypothetical protein